MRIEFEQGSKEWLDFRKDRIGASDVSAILGISPFMSRYELWLEKMGKLERKSNSAMIRGNEREEEGRKRFETAYSTMMCPAVYTNDDLPWMMASLDGIDPTETEILEIKWANKKVFEMAKRGEIPDYYKCQLLHQFACVPGAKKAYFFVCTDNDQACVELERDEQTVHDQITEVGKFYVEHIQYGIAPEAEETDVILIDNDPEFATAARKWLMAKDALTIAKQEEDEARKALLDLTDDGSCQGYGVKVKKFYQSRVDYKRACEDAGLDLDKYKKDMEIRWRISEEK